MDDLMEELRDGKLPRRWIEGEPGWQLRMLREDRLISQRQLADQAGLSQAVVSRLERGADARLGTWRRLYAAPGWDAVLVPARECEETAGMLEDERRRRLDRRDEALCAGKRRIW